MSTNATISIKRNGRFTNVYCNFDGYPEHMLGALANCTDEEILAAKEIRGIDADGTIEAYPDAIAPSVTFTPDTSLASFTYARGESGTFELV